MRTPRPLAATLCASAIGAALFAAPAHAATVNYVALGDSYSSGDGAGSYDSSSGDCLRSANAYPVKWKNAHSPASFTFAACSGATSADVKSSQLGSVSSSTTLISVSAGGNDIGFSSVMQSCVLGSDSSCQSAVTAAENKADTQLPGALGSMFAAIRGKAPSAHVVVLGYPHLYKITSFCVGLSNTKRTALNAGADHLDTAVAKATADAGYTFADVRSRFAGHELCSGDDWLHSLTYPIAESYHPTALGQNSGYLPVFTGAAG